MTTDALKKHTLYFESFEIREQAFNQSVSQLIPCKYGGPRRFWQEFNQIIHHRVPNLNQYTTAYITSNPRDCLAFGTSRQVLTAAGMLSSSGSHPINDTIEAIAQEFELSDNLDQPLRTLSGGETVKLALAKSYIMGAVCRRLSIASPFCWLSHKNIFLLEKTVNSYQNKSLPVTIYALEGEDDTQESRIKDLHLWLNPGPQFDLQMCNAQISLGTPIAEIGGRPQVAAVMDTRLALTSPCLINGENGQGKSLIAKALSNAARVRGTIAIKHQTGSARLLFQDVINQTLLRSFKSLVDSPAGIKRNRPYNLYLKILDSYKKINPYGRKKAPQDLHATVSTLLTIKMALVAVRLCTHPNALILDEPDWGLTRSSAEALVIAIVRCAHDLNVPVLIISHKPWWKELIQSSFTVQKLPQATAPNLPCRFAILLQAAKGPSHAVEA